MFRIGVHEFVGENRGKLGFLFGEHGFHVLAVAFAGGRKERTASGFAGGFEQRAEVAQEREQFRGDKFVPRQPRRFPQGQRFLRRHDGIEYRHGFVKQLVAVVFLDFFQIPLEKRLAVQRGQVFHSDARFRELGVELQIEEGAAAAFQHLVGFLLGEGAHFAAVQHLDPGGRIGF